MFIVFYVMSLLIKKISYLFFFVLKRNKRIWLDCFSNLIMFFFICFVILLIYYYEYELFDYSILINVYYVLLW